MCEGIVLMADKLSFIMDVINLNSIIAYKNPIQTNIELNRPGFIIKNTFEYYIVYAMFSLSVLAQCLCFCYAYI